MIDTHCHLDDDMLYNDAEDIVSKFKEYSVTKVIDDGSSFSSCKRSFELANRFSEVYSALGIHPEEATDYNQEVEDYIIKASENKKVVAVGEIGLDYYNEFCPRELQKKVMVTQMELAKSLKLPMVIHLRDAYEDMYNLLKDNKDKLTYGAVLHCYSGSLEMLKQYDKFDMYYSFGGSITFKNYSKYDMLRAVKEDRIMLETDSPYLTPVPFRGKINSPLNVGLVAKKLAEVKGKDVEEIIDITTRNAETIYSRIK